VRAGTTSEAVLPEVLEAGKAGLPDKTMSASKNGGKINATLSATMFLWENSKIKTNCRLKSIFLNTYFWIYMNL
jgi:hypothetical protein